MLAWLFPIPIDPLVVDEIYKNPTPFGIIHHRRDKHRIVVCRAGDVWLNLFEGYQYSSSLKKKSSLLG